MAKYWEIRESYGDKEQDPEMTEAYECGYEEGYQAAMDEMEGMDSAMGQRSGMGMRSGYRMGHRSNYGMRGGRMGNRSDGAYSEGDDNGSMGYRRRR